MAQTKILSGNHLHRERKGFTIKNGKVVCTVLYRGKDPPHWRKGIIYLGELSADKGLRSSFAGGKALSTVR